MAELIDAEPCVFCGERWVPNHSMTCKARPTKEARVAAAHAFLGIHGNQKNDPLLQDPKVLESLCRKKQERLRHLSLYPPRTPQPTSIIRRTCGAVLLFCVTLYVGFVLAHGRPKEHLLLALRGGWWVPLLCLLLSLLEMWANSRMRKPSERRPIPADPFSLPTRSQSRR